MARTYDVQDAPPTTASAFDRLPPAKWWQVANGNAVAVDVWVFIGARAYKIETVAPTTCGAVHPHARAEHVAVAFVGPAGFVGDVHVLTTDLE